MKILAIETSTEACSVAVNIDGEIKEEYKLAPRQHNQRLLTMVDDILKKTKTELGQLDAIAFGCGPGSYTGIRIAASVTQGLAVCHDLPVIPISTLLVMAQGAYHAFKSQSRSATEFKFVIPCLDARMEQVYWNLCQLGEDNLMEIFNGEHCTAPTELQLPESENDNDNDSDNNCIAVGDGWQKYEVLQQKGQQLQQVYRDLYPRASDLAKLAEKPFKDNKLLSAEQALPVYLREITFKKRALKE